MSVVWIDDKNPIPNCGTCDYELSKDKDLKQPKKIFIYDTANEVPNEIKSGKVNYRPCPNCGYWAWLWPGMLTVDRTRKRAVFCYYDDSPNAKVKLAECWSALEQYLDEGEIEQIRKRTVWVHDYRHIYQVLCESEEVFSRDVICGEKYRQRLQIPDLRSRAKQWLKDAEEVKGNIMTSREASSDFLIVLQEVIREYLEDAEESPFKEWLREILPHFDSLIQGASPPVKRRKSPIEHSESLLVPDDPLMDSSSLISFSRSKEVTNSLTKLIQTPFDPDDLENTECDQECLQGYLNAQHYLFDDDYDSIDLSLEEPLAQMKRNAPNIPIEHEGSIISIHDYLDQLNNSDNYQLAWLGEIALKQPVERALFGSALACYLAKLWRNTGSPYVRFMANVLCSNFFSIHGISHHSIRSLADACLSFYEDDRKIIMPKGTVRMYAICWQRMGRYFSSSGKSEVAIMCSGISAKFFKFGGDLDGEIRSQLDIANIKFEFHRQLNSKEIEQLLVKIISYRELEKASLQQKQIQAQELECLLILAMSQILEWGGNPEILTISVGYEVKSDDEGAKSVKSPPNFKTPIFFRFPDSDRLADANEEIPTNPDLNLASNSETEAEQSPDGTVLLQELSFGEHPSYIAGVQIWSIKWFDTLRRALKQAVKYKNEVWWHHIYFRLIELCEYIHPGVAIYFFHLLLTETEEAGFQDMSDEQFTLLQFILAKSYLQQVQGSDSPYLQDPKFSHLLDVIESRMFDLPILNSKPDLQSLTEHESESHEPNVRITSDLMVTFAELLEAGRRFSAASDMCQVYVDYCEKTIQTTQNPQIKRKFLNQRVTGLYRLARASLKHYRDNNDYKSLVIAIKAIEAYKARSILADSNVLVEDNPRERDRVTRFRTIEIDDIQGYFPDNAYIIVFALMQETNVNDGFWFSALISPEGRQILFPRFIEFEDIYDPANAVSDAFKNARSNLVDKTLNEIPDAARLFDSHIQTSLNHLGNILFPNEVIEYLESKNAERLIIIPESYLFDVPFPALKINSGDKSRYLFELNKQKGTTISVSPNLTHFQPYKPKKPYFNYGWEQNSYLATILSTSPKWRNDLVPIYGIYNRLRQMFESKAKTNDYFFELDIRKDSVQEFLDSLVKSQSVLFFGHGEITEEQGSILIANDGIISEYEVNAFSAMSRFQAQLLILCACSGINANVSAERVRKDIAGVHVALLKGGVRCVIGSLVPTFPMCGIILLQELLNSKTESSTYDKKLLNVYRAFTSHPKLSSPIFWGHFIGFGDALF